MKTLFVTPYPPLRDGIANYAVQEVQRLRAAGDHVEVLSPEPSAAHHHLDLRALRGPLALARRVGAYDRVVIQYHPDIFLPVPVTPWRRLLTTLFLLPVFVLARRLEVRVHEIDYAVARRPGPEGALTRLVWRRPDLLVVHTEDEAAALRDAYRLPDRKVAVADHGAHFVPRTDLDRAGARRRLGLPDDEVLFLSIGFIQPHKGFDRAIRAFRGLGERGCRLDVVGSVRVPEPAYLDHLAELRRLCRDTPGARVHEEYVSDERFDVWLVAADVVVLPYRHIWSSSVLERAALFDRPVIASRVGGLAGQAPEGARLVDDDIELRDAVWEAAGELGVEVGDRASIDWSTVHPDRESVVKSIQAAAEQERGGPPMPQFQAAPVRSLAARSAAGAGTGADDGPLAELRRLPPIAPPAPSSADPRARLVKKLVRRLTAWEVDPLVHQINRLRHAVLAALDPPDDADR